MDRFHIFALLESELFDRVLMIISNETKIFLRRNEIFCQRNALNMYRGSALCSVNICLKEPDLNFGLRIW